jgi:hypothetical protein
VIDEGECRLGPLDMNALVEGPLATRAGMGLLTSSSARVRFWHQQTYSMRWRMSAFGGKADRDYPPLTNLDL